jgi:hypothetical protein
MSRIDIITFLLFLVIGFAIPAVIVLHHFFIQDLIA